MNTAIEVLVIAVTVAVFGFVVYKLVKSFKNRPGKSAPGVPGATEPVEEDDEIDKIAERGED